METARIIARPHGLEVVRENGLREISHGRWEQMTRREVEARFPAEAAAWEEDPYTFAPEGGESGLAVTARALPVLLEIVRTHRGHNVIIVSHKATIRLLLSSLLGFDPRRYRDNLDQSPAALNIVDFKDAAHARLTLFNSTSHYSPAEHSDPFGALSAALKVVGRTGKMTKRVLVGRDSVEPEMRPRPARQSLALPEGISLSLRA